MLLKNFLIKYSAISKKFINNYYKFYDINNKNWYISSIHCRLY